MSILSGRANPSAFPFETTSDCAKICRDTGYRMDTLTPKQRSERMSRIRNKDSKAEMRVRKLIHSMGYRYRLHAKDILGRPDIVFRPRQKLIFVHGCFWHGHKCSLGRMPKSRLDFWQNKIQTNKERDERVLEELIAEGWRVLVIWECQIKDVDSLSARIKEFLDA